MKEIFFNISSSPESQIAIMALFVSITSIVIGIIGLHIQRKHNKKSVLPIGTINLADYENCIRVSISNNGIGPMIIENCVTRSTTELKSYPIDWIPEYIVLDTYRKKLEGHAIISGNSLTILEITIDETDQEDLKTRDEIRSILKSLIMKINYKDVYGKSFEVTRKFDWFGRHGE